MEDFSNAAQTTLAAPCTNIATTITVASNNGFPSTGQFRVLIDQEIMLVSPISTTTWTVTRAAENYNGSASAAAHSSGVAVKHVLTAGSLQGAIKNRTKTLGMVFDIRDYGAVAGGPDCSAAIQAAVDAAGAAVGVNNTFQGAVVYVPSNFSGYSLTKPVYCDWHNVGFVGDGGNRGFLIPTGNFPPIIFGVRRTQLDAVFNEATHYIDLNGIMDSSIVSGAGQKWGWNLTGDSYLTLPASPFERGADDAAFWSGIQFFTLSIAVKNNTASWFDSVSTIFGMEDDVSNPSPFTLTNVANGTFLFQFVTLDGLNRSLYIPITAATQLQKITFQFDFSVPSVTVWVNGTKVTVDQTFINFNWVAGTRFAQNWNGQFNIGRSLAAYTDLNNFKVLGLKMTEGLKYTSANTQTLVGGGSLTDLRQFYSLDYNVGISVTDFCVLTPMTAATGNNQLVPWSGLQMSNGGGCNGFGIFMKNGSGTNDTRNAPFMRDIGIQLPIGSYGQAVTIGAVYDFRVDGVEIWGGAVGLGSLKISTSYTTRLNHVRFVYQSDMSIKFWQTTCVGFNLEFQYYGRGCMQGTLGGYAVRGAFCTASDTAVRVVNLFGCSSNLEDWQVDFEGNPSPTECYVYARLGLLTDNQHISLNHWETGTIPANLPYIKLESLKQTGGVITSAYAQGYLIVENGFNIFNTATAKCLVQVDSPLWRGKFSGIPTAMPLVAHATNQSFSQRFGAESVPAAVSLGAVGGYAVTSLPGIAAWFRAQTMALGNGSHPSTLTDFSGNSFSGSKVGVGSATFNTNKFNGLSSITFDGAIAYSLSGFSPVGGGFTLICAVAPSTPAGPANIFETNVNVSNSGLKVINGTVACASSSPFLNYSPWQGSLQVFAIRVTAAPRRLELWHNLNLFQTFQQNVNTGVAWGTISHAPQVGGSYMFAQAFYTGDLCEMIVVDGALSDLNLTNSIQYLINEYNILV